MLSRITKNLLKSRIYSNKQNLFCFSTQKQNEDQPLTELTRDFLDPAQFFTALQERNIDFYTGVPDSLLKDLCGYISDHTKPSNHIITSNEGQAVALAAGYHLATGRYPMVYLQNSGLGNIVNPIMSLAHSKVYSIPMLLLVGWRGEPGKKDEPQHIVQGKHTNSILTELGVQFEILPDYIEGAIESLESATHYMQTRQAPYALVVKRQNFTNYKFKSKVKSDLPMTRQDALRVIVSKLKKHDVSVGTTGFLSRELYEIRDELNQTHSKDFLCVGSMGYASSIALGIAIQKPSRNVYCFDGDGATLMHMGALPIIGHSKAANFKHILFNNGSHDSVGAQPTVGFNTDFCKIALASGYKGAMSVDSEDQLTQALKDFTTHEGPLLLEVKVKPGAKKDLSRPKTSPIENKKGFMEFLRQ